MAGRIADLAATLYANINLSEESYAKVREALDKAHELGIEEGESLVEEKACEWLIDHVQPDGDGDEMLDDFRKAMED